MWGLKYIVGLAILVIVQCPPRVSEYLVQADMMVEMPDEESASFCNEIESYIPDSLHAHTDILYRIRMNIHFIHGSGWDGNYYGEKADYYAKELVRYANEKLWHNKKMRLPEGNDTDVIYPKYRYDLEEDGIFFHSDKDLGFYNNEGKRNNYKRDVIKKYQVGEDSVLNVFYMVHHPDSVRSKTYSASGAGIALGKSIKLGTIYNPEDPPWLYASLLNHEVGHVLGLSHAWISNDGCDDTPVNPNCWAPTETGKCKGLTSNNMMDYNRDQHAVTPCQIGKMRRTLTSLKSSKRDLLKRTWCDLNPRREVLISGRTHFAGARDMMGNITIKKGGQLRVSCRLSMPHGGEIRIEPGGELILENARLYNDCGKTWKGIVVMREDGIEGKVYKMGDIKMENVKGLPPAVE